MLGVGTLLALCLVEVLYYQHAFLILHNHVLSFTCQGILVFRSLFCIVGDRSEVGTDLVEEAGGGCSFLGTHPDERGRGTFLLSPTLMTEARGDLFLSRTLIAEAG